MSVERISPPNDGEWLHCHRPGRCRWHIFGVSPEAGLQSDEVCLMTLIEERERWHQTDEAAGLLGVGR